MWYLVSPCWHVILDYHLLINRNENKNDYLPILMRSYSKESIGFQIDKPSSYITCGILRDRPSGSPLFHFKLNTLIILPAEYQLIMNTLFQWFCWFLIPRYSKIRNSIMGSRPSEQVRRCFEEFQLSLESEDLFRHRCHIQKLLVCNVKNLGDLCNSKSCFTCLWWNLPQTLSPTMTLTSNSIGTFKWFYIVLS